MKLRTKTKAQRTLADLEQAWAYYTPEKQIESRVPHYEDLPLAA